MNVCALEDMYMSCDKVKQAKKTIIGIKQTVKAIRAGKAMEIIVASDADKKLILPVLREAELQAVPVSYIESRKALGESCGVEVGTAVVAITRY